MAGYSYFDYDQMTLLGIAVHSNELELRRLQTELIMLSTSHSFWKSV